MKIVTAVNHTLENVHANFGFLRLLFFKLLARTGQTDGRTGETRVVACCETAAQ